MHETFRDQLRQFWYNTTLTQRGQVVIGVILMLSGCLLLTRSDFHIAPVLICAGGGAFIAPVRRIYRFVATLGFTASPAAIGPLLVRGWQQGYLWGLLQIALALSLIGLMWLYVVYLRRWHRADRLATQR